MKTILQIVRLVAFLAVAFPISSSGAQVPAASKGSQAQSKVHAGLVLRGSDVLNAKVFSAQGAELGYLRDVVVDPKTGQISHAVVGSRGWQGLGEQFAIVPWHLLSQDEQKAENYVIDTDTVNFTGAPTFQRNQWATVIQPDYLAKIDKYYASPNPRPTSSEQPTTLQAFIASTVAQAGQAIAKLFQPGQQTSQAQPAKQAEEHPRKLLQIEPRPRFSRSDQAHAEKKEDKKEKTDGTQSKPATAGALASTKSRHPSSTSLADSSRKSRQSKATKHRRTSCHASRHSSMSSRSSHERGRCKCTKHKG